MVQMLRPGSVSPALCGVSSGLGTAEERHAEENRSRLSCPCYFVVLVLPSQYVCTWGEGEGGALPVHSSPA